ncbi:helix-turn-helix transcriptional regulator [Pararhizobium arenae]|uniref:helix-turn-helix transcriptional regulator n=1 Tax=Pararhizobium arenae TaxID=1856850 RepID=UPI00094ACAC5|nr:autoinducer binding domain-containing protein [Pararhizobium arenae]
MNDFSREVTSLALPTGAHISDSLKVEEDVRHVFDQVMTAYGFQGFLVMTVPGKDVRFLSDTVMMTNWSKKLLRGYDAACMLTGSPVIEQLRRSTVPFTYDARADNRRRVDGKNEMAVELFERAGLVRGVYIPVHDIHGNRGAVGFGGVRETVNAKEMTELTFLCGYLFSRLCEINGKKGRKHGPLSRREIECLHWAAAGKTTTEMARILDLSEYTVNHYLSRATRKLDSVNRVQTIAKALRAGLIH